MPPQKSSSQAQLTEAGREAHHRIEAQVVSSGQVLLTALLCAAAVAPLRVTHHQGTLHRRQFHLHEHQVYDVIILPTVQDVSAQSSYNRRCCGSITSHIGEAAPSFPLCSHSQTPLRAPKRAYED